MSTARRVRTSVATWFALWSPILPILDRGVRGLARLGALLPIMPLYFRDHGVDFTTLGIVIAAWPAARLIGEPIFGWVADRTRRVPLMVIGSALAGVFEFLPFVFVGAVPFTVFRALAGLSTAMYDPAARGTITDLTPPERRGEAFGLYSAAQMGGLLFGPAIGGLGHRGVRRRRVRVHLRRSQARSPRRSSGSWSARRPVRPARTRRPPTTRPSSRPGAATRPTRRRPEGAPPRLLNRLLLAAIIINIGGNFAAGHVRRRWLYLESLGAGIELIGFTFAMFGLPILLFSPYLGRRADRGVLIWFIVLGGSPPRSPASCTR